MSRRREEIVARIRRAAARVPPAAREGVGRLREVTERLGESLSPAVDRIVRWALRVTLRTRILLVIISVATASTIITLVLQHGSLSADLRRAALGRLEGAGIIVGQLLDGHLAAQSERYQAVSSTPQFLANLEAEHQATLSHFADELALQNRATSILFLDRAGQLLAGTGAEELYVAVRDRIRAPSAESARAGGQVEALSTLLEHGDGLYALTSVPLGEASRHVGSLVGLEPISDEEIAAWSRLCQASIHVGVEAPADRMFLHVRSIDGTQLSVSSSLEAERVALSNSYRNMIAGGLVGLALALGASILLSRSLVRPIRAIQSAAERIAGGDLQFRLEVGRRDEVGEVARALNLMLEHLEQSIRLRTRVESQMSHLAHHDSLTGLGNRRLLKDRLGSALEQRQDGESTVGVIFLDLDRFKGINDTLGHTAGDELLLEVARRLRSCVQSSVPSGEAGESEALVVRLGGDEFTVMLTDIEDRVQVEGLAERMLEELANPFELRGQEVRMSASLGIAMARDHAEDVETLLRNSDLAMFHAKDRGGRSYEFYSDSMEEIAARRVELENRLQRALQNDELELHYQPQFCLKSNQVTGLEALLRWTGSDEGNIGPAEFIAMAEETGVISPIGEWVLRTAVEQALEWQRQGLPAVRIAVNVSARQFDNREDFAQVVANLLDETQLDPSLLDLEITEGALLKDEDAVTALLERLREMGVRLSLDDFGTGYSSLSYLRRLPIETLKIDRSFIKGAGLIPEDSALLGSIVSMAKVLGMRVLAEGVETRKQQRFLEDLGCDEIQGFLLSKPLSAQDAGDFLRKRRRARRNLGFGRRRLRVT